MKVPFANLPRKVKGLLKGSNKGHRIRITPFATAQHHVIGTINPELTSITIDDVHELLILIGKLVEVDRHHDASDCESTLVYWAVEDLCYRLMDDA